MSYDFSESDVDKILRQSAQLTPKKSQLLEVENTISTTSRFELQEKLGQGAMGSVYKAFDRTLSRAVVVKQITTPSPKALKRFQLEARNNAGLFHPNIVTVYDFQTIHGCPCIIMQYVDGISLDNLLARKRLSINDVSYIFLQIMEGVFFAHKHDIIHRDLKPSNILIDKNKQIYITDFGIAKVLNSENISLPGEIIGTPMYMSPEQAKAEILDKRSDIYSLGIILYEMLTGQQVFSGCNIYSIINKVINEEPISPSHFSKNIDSGLEKFCLKALEKNKKNRFSSMDEMQKAFKKCTTKDRRALYVLGMIACIIILSFLLNIFLSKERKNLNKNIRFKNLLKKERLIKIRNFMKKYDSNRNGEISKDEFSLKRKFLEQIDIDNNKIITKKEIIKKMRLFEKIFMRDRNIFRRRSKNKFKRFDLNKDGKIKIDELKNIKIKKNFIFIDKNGDGSIILQEFRSYMHTHQKRGQKKNWRKNRD